MTLQFDDVTVKTIYNNHTEGTKVTCPLVLPPQSACFGLFWSVRRGLWVRDCLGIQKKKKTTTTTTTESLPENDSKYSSALTLESWSTFVGAPRHETTEPAYLLERTLYMTPQIVYRKTNWRTNCGRDPFKQNSNRSDREKWSTSKGGPVFSKLSGWTEPIH